MQSKKLAKRQARKGLLYEKAVARELRRRLDSFGPEGELFVGQWFSFKDKHGQQLAQPDAYILLPTRVILFEAKITQCELADWQITCLYGPLLQHYYARPILGVQVCHNLAYNPPLETFDPASLVDDSRLGPWTWQYVE